MSSRSVGIFLIAAACVVAFAIGLEAKGAEPGSDVGPTMAAAPTDPPPAMPALSIERDGSKFTAIKIHSPEGKVLAIMWPDGRVDSVSGTPQEAAAAFWSAFSGYVTGCQALAQEVAATREAKAKEADKAKAKTEK